MTVILQRYRYSVYARIVAATLEAKGLSWSAQEHDPFDKDGHTGLLHPFGRVPVLIHDDFIIYESRAICTYIDAAFTGPRLTPTEPDAQGRMQQVIGVIDAYGYVPMVRRVFAHRVFRPSEGQPGDEAMIADGLRDAASVLAALETVADEALVLNQRRISLADLHLAPMMAAFVAAPEGAEALTHYPALSQWWAWAAAQPHITVTDPGLPGLGVTTTAR